MSVSTLPRIIEKEANVIWRTKSKPGAFCDIYLYTSVWRTEDEVKAFGNKEAAGQL